MIGGADVILSTGLSPADALDTAVRMVARGWKRAVFQSGDTGRVFDAYPQIAFAGLTELLAYRDRAAFDSWEQLGADPSNGNTMVHLLAPGSGELTVVVDDPSAPQMKELLDAIRDALLDSALQRAA